LTPCKQKLRMSYKRSRDNFESDQLPQFALFGTPLPPLDSDTRDDGSYVPVWKQDARDEQGRKRFHGAFTGGYSAGYFNTVGSKEGWAPSTFTSSRTNRRKDAQVARPEDFMDDEDRAAAEDAQKLQTQGEFAGLGSTTHDQMRHGLMSDLFRRAGETIGVKLLQKMGWRQGQGVGPKVRRKARTDDTAASKPGDEIHLFAPDNSRMVAFNRKKDRFGLGYSAGERLGQARTTVQQNNEDEDDSEQLDRPTKPKSKAKRTGFGVGVLNDTGSDEEDPYDMGPKISYNRIIGGDRKKKKGGILASNANPALKGLKAPTFLSKKLGQKNGNGFRKCHDGRLPLDGFVLASSLLLTGQENKHPPPDVPEGWEPKKATSVANPNSSSHQSTADAARASTMDPAKRAAALGEEQLHGKSIFDFMSKAARDKLVTATGKSNLPMARGEAAPEGWQRSEVDKQRSMWDLVPKLDSTVAASALQRGTSGWMPYAEDESKRARYRSFLESCSGQRDALPERVKGSTIDEWTKEMREFAQAAEVFKPISGLMASRFTSSSSAPRLATDTAPSSSERPTKSEDPAEAAAKIGMFGPMTRTRIQFYPTRLLCKRFNVKAPAHADPGNGPTGDDSAVSDSRLDVVSKNKMDQMMRETWSRPSNTPAESGVPVPAESVQPQVKPQVNVEVNEAIEAARPGDDVFKAIFGSDSEDE
jgi:G patch domain-containing protein 1